MITQGTLSVIAGILFVVGFIPYIRAILVGTTKPAKASWIIWASLDTITFAGMYAKQSLNGQIVGAIIGAWIVAALALKYGTPGWTWLDKFCLAGAVLGIVLWKLFSNATFGIVTSNAAVFLGSIPTFVSAFKDPSKEDKFAWAVFWISCLCAVLAIPEFTFEDATQPITFCLIETIMMFLLYIKPLTERKTAVVNETMPVVQRVAKLVLHHDDVCKVRLTENGFCRDCKFFPDMQSTCFWYYCPSCDIPLQKMKCSKCGQTFVKPQ